MAAMRAVIVPKSYPAVGPKGGARPAWCLAGALRDLGWSVEIITTTHGPDQSSYSWETVADADGWPVTRVLPGTVVSPRQAVWRALEDRGPFDLVVCTDPGHYGQPAVMAARTWQVPALAYVAGDDVLTDAHDPTWAPFIAWTLAAADHVAASTAQMADLARGFRSDATADVWPETLYPGAAEAMARAEAERHWGLTAVPLRIGLVGIGADGDGLADALTAFGLVHRQRPEVRLALSMAQPIPIQQQLDVWLRHDPHSARGVDMLPPAEDRDLPGLLAMCDQLWLPQRLGTNVDRLWAGMAAGLPIVATAVGTAGMALVDGETGLVVPPGEPAALAKAALRLAAEPDWARTLGAAGRTALPPQAHPQALTAALGGWLAASGVGAAAAP